MQTELHLYLEVERIRGNEIIIEVNETNCLESGAVLNGVSFANALNEVMSLQILSLLLIISVPDYKIAPSYFRIWSWGFSSKR